MKASEWEQLDWETWRSTFREAAAPVLTELEQAGLRLERLVDLQHVRLPKETVDMLLKWLPRVEHPGVKETIARGVADPRARPLAAPVLIAEYRRPENDSYGVQEALGVALGVTARDESFDDLVELIRIPARGPAGSSWSRRSAA